MSENDVIRSGSPTDLVYIINSLQVGGAEVGMCRLLDGLDFGQYDVTVIALDGHSDDLLDRLPSGLRVLDLQLTDGPGLTALREFWSSIRSADVIVGSLFHSAMAARLAGVANPDATVATWHHAEQFKTDFRRFLFGRTLRLTDVVLADSEPVAEMLMNEFDADRELVHTVPIAGISPSDFTLRQHEQRDPIVVGSIGRITPQKNFSAVLSVAEQLPTARFKFRIAGEGPKLEQLRTDAVDRDLSIISFLGHEHDIDGFLGDIDIYFQPSRHEGLCITVLEAMAAGLPVVGSDVGGIGRNVKHEESGFLCEPDNIDEFASRIKELAADSHLRQRFGNRGRAIVEASFTQEALVTEFEKSIETNK